MVFECYFFVRACTVQFTIRVFTLQSLVNIVLQTRGSFLLSVDRLSPVRCRSLSRSWSWSLAGQEQLHSVADHVTGLAQVVLSSLSHVFSVDALDCTCMSPELYLPHTSAHQFVFAQQTFPIPFVLDETASFGPHPLLLRRADLWLSCCSVWPVYVASR